MKSDVDTIKERLPIVELVSGYLELEKTGHNFKARCPFHNEKTASFHISTDRNLYYCFGCQAKGDIFTFIQAIEGLDFPGALKLLAERTGVELSREHKGLPKKERDNLYELLEESASFFESRCQANEDVKAYLKDRGLEERTAKKFRIGFAEDEWRSLYEHLTKKGYSKTAMERAGVVISREGKTYDRFRSRIMFPLLDPTGRVIAFSGRLYESKGSARTAGSEAPKYVNSPETDLFNKSLFLFGFDTAKHAIRKYDFSILVEGQFDLVLSHQAGFPMSVATSGTSITKGHLELLKRLSDNIVLALDGDHAGIESAYKTAALALSLGMHVKIALLPEGKDPADLVREGGSSKLKEAIRNAEDAVLFFLARGGDVHKKSASWTKRAQYVLPLVAAVPSALEREQFVSEIARKTGIREAALLEELEDSRKVLRASQERREYSDLADRATSLSTESAKAGVRRPLSRTELIARELSAIALQTGEAAGEIKKDIYDTLTRLGLEPAEEGSVTDLLLAYESGQRRVTVEIVDELKANLERSLLEGQITDAQRELENLSSEENDEAVFEILGRINDLTGRLALIKDHSN